MTVSVVFATNCAHISPILLNMFHVLALVVLVVLLNMLVKIELLRERARAMWAFMRFRNHRFWTFLSLVFFITFSLIFIIGLFDLLLVLFLFLRDINHLRIDVRRVYADLALFLNAEWSDLTRS